MGEDLEIYETLLDLMTELGRVVRGYDKKTTVPSNTDTLLLQLEKKIPVADIIIEAETFSNKLFVIHGILKRLTPLRVSDLLTSQTKHYWDQENISTVFDQPNLIGINCYGSNVLAELWKSDVLTEHHRQTVIEYIHTLFELLKQRDKLLESEWNCDF